MQPTEELANGPYFVVFNPRSGSSRGTDVTTLLEQAFSETGRSHELLPVHGEDLTSVAKRAVQRAKQQHGTVVAAGGDGTIRCVVQQALGSGRPFGIIPRGTFNITGRTYGIPLELQPAVDALVRARIRRVQVGTVNGHVFLVNASLGLYPELLEEREQYKRQFGRKRSIAFFAALVTLLRDHRQLVLHTEHEKGRELMTASTLFVGNNPMQLEQVGLPEADDVKKHKLAAVFVKPVDKLERLGLFARGLRGKLAGAPALHDFPFEQLTVRPQHRRKRKFKVALDGEIMRLASPLEFKLAPQALQLLVPAP
jgi:diacylglycerol kinase family enzyme